MKVLITGASSGIGEYLAYEYAKTGANLFITGRSKKRLDKVAKKIKELGGNPKTFILDVCDKKKMETTIHKMGVLDIVIANAGISTGTLAEHDASEAKSRQVFNTNILGVLNTIYPALPAMKKRHKGHIVIMSSMASFTGLGGASAYCSSKACVRILGQSLSIDLKRYNINTSIICPGWVKSPLTDKNDFKMPMLMDTNKAAKIIIKGLNKRKILIVFPKTIYIIARILEFLPIRISDMILAKLPNKE